MNFHHQSLNPRTPMRTHRLPSHIHGPPTGAIGCPPKIWVQKPANQRSFNLKIFIVIFLDHHFHQLRVVWISGCFPLLSALCKSTPCSGQPINELRTIVRRKAFIELEWSRNWNKITRVFCDQSKVDDQIFFVFLPVKRWRFANIYLAFVRSSHFLLHVRYPNYAFDSSAKIY